MFTEISEAEPRIWPACSVACPSNCKTHTGGESTLRAIVNGAGAIVPGARWAGIWMIKGRRGCRGAVRATLKETNHACTQQIRRCFMPERW